MVVEMKKMCDVLKDCTNESTVGLTGTDKKKVQKKNSIKEKARRELLRIASRLEDELAKSKGFGS